MLLDYGGTRMNIWDLSRCRTNICFQQNMERLSQETLEAAVCLSDPFHGDEHDACFFMPLVEICRNETVDYFNWYCFVLAVRLNEMMHSDSVHYILISVH